MIGVAVAIGEAGGQDAVDFGVILGRQGDVGPLGELAQVGGRAGAGDRDQVITF